LPQGSPKKIEFNLLLADLAFQFGDLPLGRRHHARSVSCFARNTTHRWPASPPRETRRAKPSVNVRPAIQKCPADLHLSRKVARRFPSQHPLDNLELQLRTEDTAILRHQFSSRELSPI
jgi:hypothetical protein